MSATPYHGEGCQEGELRGRKTVVEYTKMNTSYQDEVYAINGSAWAGPWANENCTFNAKKKEWIVPETETVGGWKYSIPNPNYEKEIISNPKAKKTIGNLPYTKKYDNFRIQLCGMQKSGTQIVEGPVNNAHTEWIAFDDNGNSVYGSHQEYPSKKYTAALSGAKIIDNGIYKESDWASGGPKTILGTRPNGDIVIMTSVGRQKDFYSFTPLEHCEIMDFLGCDNAICLDGGGSTSMIYKFKNSNNITNIATCSGKTTNRAVVNSLLFYIKEK